MGLYSGFLYGEGVVYGPTAIAQRADVLANNLVVIYFDTEVLTNADYYNVNNYVITLDEGAGDNVAVLEVLRVNAPALNRVYLRTSYHTQGATYRLVAQNLVTRSGGPMVGDFRFKSRATKLDSMYANIPAHFSSDANSLIRNILLAIAQVDDIIGGSRNDTLP